MEPLYNGQLGATIFVHYSWVSALEGLRICMYLTIGAQRFVCYIEVSAIEGCPLSGISLYIHTYISCTVCHWNQLFRQDIYFSPQLIIIIMNMFKNEVVSNNMLLAAGRLHFLAVVTLMSVGRLINPWCGGASSIIVVVLCICYPSLLPYAHAAGEK